MAESRDQLDTTIEIVTPENIAFEYRVAGPFRRLPAYLIDLVIRFGILFVGNLGLMVAFATLGLEGVAFGLTLVLLFVVVVLYGGVLETVMNGQTPGKYVMHIRVISVDGQPITAFQAMLRNILRAIDMQPIIFYQLGLLVASSNRRFQRLGDLVSGTMVVVEERSWLSGPVHTGEPHAAMLAAQIPPSFVPTRHLVKTLATYVQRRRSFSAARRVEIARHLAEPLRQRFGWPADTNPDLLLCALYHRVFLTERESVANSPFRERSTTAAVVPAGAVGRAEQVPV
ncbi:MAG: RDD family protein [Planctomycetota bacterium]